MTIAARQCREWIVKEFPGTPISRFACRNTSSGAISQHSAYGSPTPPGSLSDSNAIDVFGPKKTSSPSDQAHIQKIVDALNLNADQWSIRKIIWRDGGAHENHAHIDFLPMIGIRKWCGGPETPPWRLSTGDTVVTRNPEPEFGRFDGGNGMGHENGYDNIDEYRREHNVNNPPAWSDDMWEAYMEAGGSSVPESQGWPASRFDLAWIHDKFILPLEQQLDQVFARLDALEAGDGGNGGAPGVPFDATITPIVSEET